MLSREDYRKIKAMSKEEMSRWLQIEHNLTHNKLRRQFEEVNCSHTVQYRKAPGKFLQLNMYSVQSLSCVLLFAIAWTSAHHCILNPHKSKLP